MMRKVLSLSVALAMGAAGGGGGDQKPRAAVRNAGCANETLPTFKVEGRALKPRYRPGDTAKVAVSVKRSLEGLGLTRSAGAEVHHGGVEDAMVGIQLTMGAVRVAGAAVTNETGRAVVEIPLPKNSPGGWAIGGGRGWKDLVSQPCPVTEEGILRTAKLFRISATR